MSKELPSLKIGQCESRYPIILGGMSVGLTTAKMAGAVANEGGFGTIGGIGLGISPEIKNQESYFKANELALKKEINDALEISNDGNIGVNLMVAAMDYENLVKTAVEQKVKYIVSGAGLPLFLPEYVEKYKSSEDTKPELVPIVSSLQAARIIIKKWEKNYKILPAAIVVETPNTAGGHLGVTKVEDIGKEEFGLEKVIPELLNYLEENGYTKENNRFIPIIAAGGIWSKTDINQVLDIGASGAQMSTRFLTTIECNASPEFKTRHLFNTDPIVIIKSPVGMPGRAIENNFIKEVGLGKRFNFGPCVECLYGCEYRKTGTGYCIVRSLDNVHKGEVEKGVLFTGSNGNRLKEDREKEIVSVGQIFDDLTAE